MTILFQYDAENGTNAANVTALLGGYGAVSATPPVYSNAWSKAGALSILYKRTSNGVLQVRCTITPSTTPDYRSYMKLVSATPSGNLSILVAYAADGTTVVGDVRLLTTGKIQLRNSSFVAIASSSHTFTAGEEVRVEYAPRPGGTSVLRLFYGANVDGVTADETISGANGGSGSVGMIYEGGNTSATYEFHIDNTIIQDNGAVGPLAAAISGYFGTPLN